MQIETSTCGIYRIIKISDTMSVVSQLEELRSLIKGYVASGQKFMAINFTDASYLYSGAVGVLVSCYKVVRDIGGDLCLVEAKPQLLELLRQMGIDQLLNLYDSVESLPADQRQIEHIRADYLGSRATAGQRAS